MRRPALVLALSLLLVPAGLVGCSDDDGDDAATTTTEAPADGAEDPGDTTETAVDDTATDGSSTTEGDTTTSEAGPTTSPNLPPNDSPLVDLLIDPTVIGPGFAPDDALGDGSFDTDLCEEVTLEETWEDQAAQALTAGEGMAASAFQQTVLRFPDDAAAGEFVATVSEALVTCQEGTTVEPVEGVGDEAVLATADAAEIATAAAMVRVGPLVTWLLSIGAPGSTTPLDEDVLATAADQLTA